MALRRDHGDRGHRACRGCGAGDPRRLCRESQRRAALPECAGDAMIDRVDVLRASAALTGIVFVQISPDQRELTLSRRNAVLRSGVAALLAKLGPADITI